MSDTKSATYGSGNGTERVYAVEARTTYGQPQQFRGMLLDGQWRRIAFTESPIGVNVRVWSPLARKAGLLDFNAALALAHWWMTEENFREPGLCVETRLTAVKFTYSYKTEEVGVGPSMSLLTTRRATKFEAREALETKAEIEQTERVGR